MICACEKPVNFRIADRPECMLRTRAEAVRRNVVAVKRARNRVAAESAHRDGQGHTSRSSCSSKPHPEDDRPEIPPNWYSLKLEAGKEYPASNCG